MIASRPGPAPVNGSSGAHRPRSFAVGVNGRLFSTAGQPVEPHFGWVPWLALAGLGCLAIAAAGIAAKRAAPSAAMDTTDAPGAPGARETRPRFRAGVGAELE